MPTTLWPAEDLWLEIVPKLPGFTVEVLPEIDSTNSELMRRARAGLAEPALLIAESQTAGRGRQGRTWQNQPGDCLMYSLGMMLQPLDWSGLSLVVGLSIAESLQPAPPTDANLRIGVKWPNDLWLGDGHKLAGTLIETANLPAFVHATAYGNGPGPARFVIIGTGINIRPPAAFPPAALSRPPACLQDLTQEWSAPSALHTILPRLVDDILHFAHYGLTPFLPRFALRDALRGQQVHVSDGRSGQAIGLADDGALLLRSPEGLCHINSGDVSVRPMHMPLPSSNV